VVLRVLRALAERVIHLNDGGVRLMKHQSYLNRAIVMAPLRAIKESEHA